MSRKKLIRREENKNNSIVLEPSKGNFNYLKGNWSVVFGNDNPIILELACGRGEYCVGLGEKIKDKNFIGVDLKGERLWQGAKQCEKNELDNVRFLQIDIRLIEEFFAESEVEEILIIHPDPQPKKPRKRLTHPVFLRKYNSIIKPSGYVYLKTDSDLFFDYTKKILNEYNAKVVELNTDSNKKFIGEHKITTNFESKAIEQGRSIKLLKFLVDVFSNDSLDS